MIYEIVDINVHGLIIENKDDDMDRDCIKPTQVLGKYRKGSELVKLDNETYRVTKYVSNPDCPDGSCPIK